MAQPEPNAREGSGLSRLVVTTGLSNVADGAALIAWAWLASMLTRDPILVAALPLALRLPWLLLSLPAGIIVDRTDRRRLILTMDAIRTLSFGLVAIAVCSALPLAPPARQGASELWLFITLIACAVLIGSAEVFRDTAAQTLLPAIVPPRDLERANSRLYSAELIGNTLLGPAIGAFLIAWIVWLPFAANSALLIVALFVLQGLRGRFAPTMRAKRNWRQELKEGLSFLRDRPFLQVLAIATAVWNLFHQMVVIALILHVQENLGLDARAYGLILATGAAGGVMAGLVAERGIAIIGAGAAAQWSSLASAVAFTVLCVAPNALSLAAVLVFFEFSSVFWNVVSLSYRQRTIPDAVLGRVNGVYRLLSWGMMSLGLILSGVVVSTAEKVVAREMALVTPFLLVGVATFILTAAVWKALGEGFGNDAPGSRP